MGSSGHPQGFPQPDVGAEKAVPGSRIDRGDQIAGAAAVVGRLAAVADVSASILPDVPGKSGRPAQPPPTRHPRYLAGRVK
jgi:hypothetical protein